MATRYLTRQVFRRSHSTANKVTPESVLRNVLVLGEANPSLLPELGRSLSSKSLDSLYKATTSQLHLLENAVANPPTSKQLLIVCITPFPLFIAFGIIDNAVMIIAGEYFDLTIGVTFGISTMAAAALGNLVSDVMGLGLGGVVEESFEKLGWVKEAGLSRLQETLPIVRRVRLLGSAIGVVIGCLIGMFPLLFMDTDQSARLKRQGKIDEMFTSVMDFITQALEAHKTLLFIVDKETGELWTRKNQHGKMERFKCDNDTAIQCARNGDISNGTVATSSVLCSPVFDGDGRVIGVIHVSKSRVCPFRVKDEVALTAMASHISCALEKVLNNDSETDTNSLLSALKASHEHYSHHLRFVTERAKGGRVAFIDKE